MEEKELQHNGMSQSETQSNNSALPPEEAQQAELNIDENVGGTTHLSDEMEEPSVVEKLENELAECKDKYLRLVAEFDNYKKRTARERIELMQTAGREIIVSLLDVLDDFDRAIQQLDQAKDITALKEGIHLIYNKFKSILQSKGLKEMETLHAHFDPELHEAISEVPAPDENLKGKVLDYVQKGYLLNDKIIRHAKVVVGK
ncbi:molecular chaperone GrpE [Thermoflavifilum aggregans]|uniref:Protein GrpE n=1 Tax=Thermoflavifilum aggregans TaxID=454188 RepID=A0A2M9CX97_9BACT|nr:nucleotide exchange factor GrpE [Thermoflavifilum aggregans]MBX6380610.1 nucleotide exchange factor GrpE [Thermoflavifilum aggregans]PJJ76531.1 molecular chaperone GrpE [Thermoflavifilum aggregans]